MGIFVDALVFSLMTLSFLFIQFFPDTILSLFGIYIMELFFRSEAFIKKTKHNVWYIFEIRDQSIFDISFYINYLIPGTHYQL